MGKIIKLFLLIITILSFHIFWSWLFIFYDYEYLERVISELNIKLIIAKEQVQKHNIFN